MCVKIIGPENEYEFDPSQPLEEQIKDAKEVFVSYNPKDSKIPSFIRELDKLCINGTSCKLSFKFKANNNLEGFRMERQLEKIRQNFEVNEIVRSLVTMYTNTDKKLEEISNGLLGKVNE